MVSRFKVTRLDPKLRATVDDQIAEGRATIDEITRALRDAAGSDAPSRGAVWRYAKHFREELPESMKGPGRPIVMQSHLVEIRLTNQKLDCVLERLDRVLELLSS